MWLSGGGYKIEKEQDEREFPAHPDPEESVPGADADGLSHEVLSAGGAGEDEGNHAAPILAEFYGGNPAHGVGHGTF